MNGASVSIGSFARVAVAIILYVPVVAGAGAVVVDGAVSGAATVVVGMSFVVVVLTATVVISA